MKVREVVKLQERDRWYLLRVRGSHRHFKHDSKPGLVTVPGNSGKDLARGTLGSILKQARLKK
ncbi:MAG: addiction module toxin, HicA family [Lysobacterales bacterium]|nr:MAG: addiction module toxin, HicA family [Xanthomonadales bacterium]